MVNIFFIIQGAEKKKRNEGRLLTKNLRLFSHKRMLQKLSAVLLELLRYVRGERAMRHYRLSFFVIRKIIYAGAHFVFVSEIHGTTTLYGSGVGGGVTEVLFLDASTCPSYFI